MRQNLTDLNVLEIVHGTGMGASIRVNPAAARELAQELNEIAEEAEREQS